MCFIILTVNTVTKYCGITPACYYLCLSVGLFISVTVCQQFIKCFGTCPICYDLFNKDRIGARFRKSIQIFHQVWPQDITSQMQSLYTNVYMEMNFRIGKGKLCYTPMK